MVVLDCFLLNNVGLSLFNNLFELEFYLADFEHISGSDVMSLSWFYNTPEKIGVVGVHVFYGDLLELVNTKHEGCIFEGSLLVLKQLFVGENVYCFSLIDKEGGGADDLRLLLDSAILEVKELMGLSLAENNLDKEVGFGVLLSHFSVLL